MATTDDLPPRLRPATIDDASDIAGLASELGYQVTGAHVGAYLAGVIPAVEAVFLACDHQRTLGWVHIKRHESIIAPAYAGIEGLVVGAAYRRRGIGTALLRRAEEWAGGRGLGLVRLRSSSARVEAHAFYPSLGYRRTKQQQVYGKVLDV
jgi:GNAT superfamily N-acetyltransferase